MAILGRYCLCTERTSSGNETRLRTGLEICTQHIQHCFPTDQSQPMLPATAQPNIHTPLPIYTHTIRGQDNNHNHMTICLIYQIWYTHTHTHEHIREMNEMDEDLYNKQTEPAFTVFDKSHINRCVICTNIAMQTVAVGRDREKARERDRDMPAHPRQPFDNYTHNIYWW